MNHYEQPGFEYKATKMLVLSGAMKYINRWRVRNSPNFCFIWVPKTAGTSVFRLFRDQVAMKQYLRLDYVKGAFPNAGAATFGHMSYQQLLEAGLVSSQYDQKAFKFAFVRNPFDRAVSLYYYLIRINVISSDLNFKAFLERIKQGIEPIGMYNVKGLSQCNPQVDWICDSHGKIWVDYVADVERFSEGISELATRAGIQTIEYHENKTVRTHTLSDLYRDRECVDMVVEIYRRDFQLLGYSYDPAVPFRITKS